MRPAVSSEGASSSHPVQLVFHAAAGLCGWRDRAKILKVKPTTISVALAGREPLQFFATAR